MNPRAAAVWPWLAGALLSLPLLYVLSFGPACWWFSERDPRTRARMVPPAYWRMGAASRWSNGGLISRFVTWYATLRTPVVLIEIESPTRQTLEPYPMTLMR